MTFADAPDMLLALAAVWAVAALALQVRGALRARARDVAAPAGDARRGALSSLGATALMWRKDAVRQHPWIALAGAALHAGVGAAAIAAAFSRALAEAPSGLRLALAAAAGAGLVAEALLVVRRWRSAGLREISSADDAAAGGATILLLAAALAFLVAPGSRPVLLLATAAVLAYLPLGKLRHSVFFWVARAELGWRLGRRGIYVGHATR
ncbi:MAG: hypothetical protein KBD01_00205 [Acidobacteria bacterium]|nr:hypothetical protein [Acidobacteriota bacterium]